MISSAPTAATDYFRPNPCSIFARSAVACSHPAICARRVKTFTPAHEMETPTIDGFDMETQTLTRADVLNWTSGKPLLRIVPDEDLGEHIAHYWRPLVKFTFADSQIENDVFFIMEQIVNFPTENKRFQLIDARAIKSFEALGYSETARYTKSGRTYVCMALAD